VVRPGSWSEVITAVFVALVAAALLTAAVPRLARRDRSATAAR
jgi:hypothetical protein